MRMAKGFTLIELMIVVVILSVLVLIAVPAYNEQMKRGRRADGKAFIMDMASKEERFYTQYSSYTSVLVGPSACTGVACGLNFTQNLSKEGLYTGSITLLPASCAPGGASPCTQYTITVTPVSSDPKCTTLTLTNTGIEGYTGTASTAEECWR